MTFDTHTYIYIYYSFIDTHPLNLKPTNTQNPVGKSTLRVPDMVQQKFTATHHELLKKIEEKISQDASVQKAVQMTESGSSSAGPTQSRTMGSPQWENETPLIWRKTLSLAGISVAAFDASNTHHQLVFRLYHCMCCFCLLPSNSRDDFVVILS